MRGAWEEQEREESEEERRRTLLQHFTSASSPLLRANENAADVAGGVKPALFCLCLCLVFNRKTKDCSG